MERLLLPLLLALDLRAPKVRLRCRFWYADGVSVLL